MKTNIKLLTWLAVFVGVLSESHFDDPQLQLPEPFSASYRGVTGKSLKGSSRFTLKIKDLWRTPQVLCVVFVDPKKTSDPKHYKNALMVKETWGRKCNDLIFYGRKADKYLPSVIPPDLSAASTVFEAFLMNFSEVENRLEEFDWIFFACDDTYVVVENLRHFLARQDPSKRLAVGLRFKVKSKACPPLYTHMGFAVSIEAFQKLVSRRVLTECLKYKSGDLFSFACLEEAGVDIIDSRDSLGRQKITTNNPGMYLKRNFYSEEDVLQLDSYYAIPKGPECCADYYISSWVQSTNEIYTLDFMSHDFQFLQKTRKPNWTATSNSSNIGILPTANMTFRNFLPVGVNRKLRDKGIGFGRWEIITGVKSTGSLNNKLPEDLPEYKILCLVNTTHSFHQTLALDIKSTWGKRCTKLVFVSDSEDRYLPALNAAAGDAWTKLKTSILFYYEVLFDEIDWIVLTQHDGYVFFKNLAPLLGQFNPSDKLVLGSRFKSKKSDLGYVPFECGVILSKGAVKAFVEQALHIGRCKKGSLVNMAEEFSQCLDDAGVQFVDSRDGLSRARFFPDALEYFYSPDLMLVRMGSWYMNRTFYPHSFGENCCAAGVVSVGLNEPSSLYMFDFFETRFKLRSNDYPDSGMQP